MAAEALKADEAMFAGAQFYAAATAIEDQVGRLHLELKRLAEVWRSERRQ
jgi:hypothetical protein